MSRPSVVAFDLGKVLVDYDYSIASRRILRRTRLTDGEMQRLLCTSPLLCQYETGAINTAQFYEGVRAASGYDGGLEEFGRAFADIFTEIEPMTALHAALRAAGVRTWIFSNTNELAERHIRARFPFFSNFDGYVLSYEQGAMKPDAKLYEVVERQTGCRGGAILYLDDRPENVAAGLARGWRAVLHETPEKTRSHIASLGLPTGQL
ncbi:MAG TPA: HAD family phosphatase [Candidatus Acidoferrum sp.]|nr:HAD family phosphatase [Candidatus Acidoferrum sp.]